MIDTDVAPRRSSTSLRRPSWRNGSRTVDAWDLRLLLIALVAFGAGLAVSSVAGSMSTAGGWISRAALWAGMIVPILLAFARSRPRGLLRFQPQDLLYGLAVGLVLRTMQGWLSVAAGGGEGFPSLPLGNGQVAAGTWFSFGVSPVIFAPVIEEFFFHGVVLVAVFSVLRSNYRRGSALFTASTISTALFVIAHTAMTTSTWDEIVSVVLLGGVCAALVATTGRIWPAIIAHAAYNAIFALLTAVGSLA